MNYLSLCSGIEAATVAWEPLGWKPVGFSEIDPFPCAVLAHHYPNVPNFGDMTQYEKWPLARLRKLLANGAIVGGTPCQAFSVAGLRGGMADARGNLALVYLRIVAALRPRWFLWENVPGVLSSYSCDDPERDAFVERGDVGGPASARFEESSDFGSFLAGVDELGYGYAWRTLDAQYFNLAQQRERVFVVGHSRGWTRAAAALFEGDSLRRHSPPRRRPGARLAAGALRRVDGGSERAGTLTARYGDSYLGGNELAPGQLVAVDVAGALTSVHGGPDVKQAAAGQFIGYAPEHSRTLNAGGMGRQDLDTETFVVAPPLTSSPYADRGAADEGKLIVDPFAFEARYFTRENKTSGAPSDKVPALTSQTKAGDSMPLVCIPEPHCFRGAGQDRYTPKDLSPALAASDGGLTVPTVVAFSRERGDDGRGYDRPPAVSEDVSPTLDTVKPPTVAFMSTLSNTGTMEEVSPTLVTDNPVAVCAYSFQQRIARNDRGDGGDVVPALTSEAGKDGRGDSAPCVAVRIHGSDERVTTGASLTDVATAIRTKAPGAIENSTTTNAVHSYGVRRLTCVECEILQGFRPNYTLIPWGTRKRSPEDFAETFAYLRRHGMSEEDAWILADTPDGPRYKAIGNSMATHVVRWIGEQIQAVDKIK